MNSIKSWLWPDHNISKRESRELREEHNKLVNSYAALVKVLQTSTTLLEDTDATPVQKAETARAIISAALAQNKG